VVVQRGFTVFRETVEKTWEIVLVSRNNLKNTEHVHKTCVWTTSLHACAKRGVNLSSKWKRYYVILFWQQWRAWIH